MTNSSQINFYLTQNDQASLENRIREVSDFVPFAATYEGDVPRRLDSAAIENMGEQRLKIYICDPKQTEFLIGSRVPQKSYNSVDVFSSLAIEFSRCFYADKCVGRGRFYYISRYYDHGRLVSKNSDFLSWAALIFKTTKSALERNPDGYYLGSEAKTLLLK